jgi:hypothetical protein
MSQQELLNRVVQALTDAGVEYMVTGSVVSSLQGEPRATHDIDILIALSAATAAKLIAAFPPPEFYLNEWSQRLGVEDLWQRLQAEAELI